MATLRPVTLRGCGVGPRAPASLRAPCRSAVRHVGFARAAPRAAAVKGLDALSPPGTADLTLFSPSKINLFLRIVRRREDGYHDLASLFHVIDFGDTLEVSQSTSPLHDSLTCSAPGVPLDESNLVMKAFALFRRKTGSKQHYWANLVKRVPAGAGLGGGSGNAATALWAANELAGRPASEADLLAWSGEIGSDISVFFSTGAAYCTGRGEVVRNEAPPLPLGTKLLLIKPQEGLSTPLVFKNLDLATRSSADPEGLLAALAARGCGAAVCVNDLEPPAFKVMPQLAQLKQRLLATGRYQAVFMSGSGSTIVCVGDDDAPDWAAAEGLFTARAVRLTTRKPGHWYAAPPPRP